jgi:hypothetical protein
LSTTGSVPQLGPAAAALADGLVPALALADEAAVGVAVGGAVDAGGVTEAPGAHALTMIASDARLMAKIPGLRTDRPRVNGPSRLALNIWVLLLGFRLTS